MSVLDFTCPFCGAKPKEPCTRPGQPSQYPREPTHFSRFAEALIDLLPEVPSE